MISIHIPIDFYTEGRSQRLKREEDSDRNHDKKAIAADSWNLVHSFRTQNPSEARRRLLTLADEHDAASDRKDRIQSPKTTIDSIPACRDGRLMKTEHMSTTAKVKLHGIINPIIVTKKQKAV